MLADDVMSRLKAEVSDFSNRVYGAADLSALVHKGRLPQVTPAAHVVPAGLVAGKAAGLTGQFRQSVQRNISVVVTFRNRDKVSKRGLDGIEALLETVITKIAGWTPDPNTTGVFEMRGTKLLSMAGDALVYQLDFALPDQLRINS